MDFKDYADQLDKLNKQEMEAELNSFYTINYGILKFYEAIDTQFQSLIKSSNFASKTIENFLISANQMLPMLKSFKFEISMLDENSLSNLFKSEILKTVKYIKEVMEITEAESLKQRFIKLLNDDKLKIKEEKDEIDRKEQEKAKLEEERIKLEELEKKRKADETRENLRREEEDRQNMVHENKKIEEEKNQKLKLEQIRIEAEVKEKLRIEEEIKKKEAEAKEKERFENLRKKEEEKKKYEDGSIFIEPIRARNLAKVKELIRNGANINGLIKYDSSGYYVGNTVMHLAICSNMEILKEIIKAGANLDNTCYMSYPPLFWLIQDGKIEMIQELIRSGANLNFVRFWNGKLELPFLMKAIEKYNLEIVKMLIDAGAKLEYHKTIEGYDRSFYFIDWVFEHHTYANADSIKKYLIQVGAKSARYEYYLDKKGGIMSKTIKK